jgi:cyclopropane fatty-acyl-phospholipid synthase-like methyltransferase
MSTKVRADFSAIANWIQPHSSLLDLGCGDGDFLEYIRAQKPSVPKTSNKGSPAEKPKKNIRSVIFWV